MITTPPLAPPSDPVPGTTSSGTAPCLSLKLLIPWLIIFLCVGISIVAWTGAYDPAPWKNVTTPWPNPLSTTLVLVMVGGLILIPLCWVIWWRTLDLLTLTLAQAALVFCGYYYLDLTAVHLTDATYAILETTGLVVLFNAVGFLFFFASLGLSYGLVSFANYRLAPLPAPGPLLDRRFILFMRVLSVFCAVSIALPMALTHTIPLLSSNGSEARLDMVMQSDTGRAIYHMGSTLLPFVVGTLFIAMARQPWRIFGLNGAITGLMVFLQLLTSNRLPLSITLMVALCLFTMQYRLPRWLLAAIIFGYIFLFTFLSGFSSLLRSDPHALEEETWFSDSIQEAFLGDNIIDLRDGAWVFSQWDYRPLMGRTYMGGLVSMMPSGLFPQKKQWHLGLTGVRIVGLPEEEHFGLRITFFGEAFLNFGWAGVIMLGTMLGAAFGIVLRQIHLAASQPGETCLWRNVTLLMLLECGFPLSNTSDAFIFWVLVVVLTLIWFFVIVPARREHSHLLSA
jgi:hypothetical protein